MKRRVFDTERAGLSGRLPTMLRRGLIVGFALAAGLFTGCDDVTVFGGNAVFEIMPLELDFGVVELGQQNVLGVAIRNLETTIGGEVTDIVIEDDCGGCFLNQNEIGEVDAGETKELQLRFRAVRLEEARGTATLTTDEPGNETVVIMMRGEGSDTRRPCVEVFPERVDFGFVPAGGVALSSFVIRSCGTNNLLIDRIAIEPLDAPFRITTSTPTPQMPGELAPGEQASVSLRAELPESASATTSATIVIETNVPEAQNVPDEVGVVHVPVSAQPNLPPVAMTCLEQKVEPWTRATLDGAASFDRDDPPDDPLSYRWTLISSPGGSTTVLERANTSQPSFWVDLTGRYEVELIVTDALGLESAPAVCTVEALPTNAIRIELVWDHPDADLDLHLIRAGGSFCDCENDVHYRDCGVAPNWFPMSPGANPRLDIDDRNGFGPENINIDGHGADRFIPDGEYTIAVHYFSSNAGVSMWPTRTANATVRIFVFGLLAAEFSHAMVEDFCPEGEDPLEIQMCDISGDPCLQDTDCQIGGELWTAGRIEWPTGTISGVDAVQRNQICSIF